MSTNGSNYTLAIKYDNSFQLMKRLCDDISPFVLASIQVESGELFQEEEVRKDLRPQWYIERYKAEGVVLANELNPVLTS